MRVVAVARGGMIALSAKGELTIVEIKVSKADLVGDRKWTDYLDYCDRYYWAVPSGFESSTSQIAVPRGGRTRVSREITA